MSEISFNQINDNRQLSLTIDGDTTWMVVAEEFISFLQGCGYQVTGAEVADYLLQVHCGVDDPFNFDLASDQFEQDTTSAEVTLDDVMHMWGKQPTVAPTNTITITTR